MANILTDFLVGFHWHGVNARKETYRFFRDDENKREYNSAVRLLNASIWLTDFYKTNVVVNRKTYNCLDRRKDELEAALSDDNGKVRCWIFCLIYG